MIRSMWSDEISSGSRYLISLGLALEVGPTDGKVDFTWPDNPALRCRVRSVFAKSTPPIDLFPGLQITSKRDYLGGGSHSIQSRRGYTSGPDPGSACLGEDLQVGIWVH